MLMIMNFKKRSKGGKVSKHWRCDRRMWVQILHGRPFKKRFDGYNNEEVNVLGKIIGNLHSLI